MDISGILSKKQIQELRLLHKRQERYAQGRFVVEGHRAVIQVLRNRELDVLFLLVSGEYLESLNNEAGYGSGRDHSDETDETQDSGSGPAPAPAHLPGVDVPWSGPVYQVSARVITRISDTETAQGIMAVCRLPDPLPLDAMLEQTGVVLATDRIRDPGNLGTMIRSAVWFGLKGLVLSDGTTDLFHPKVVRSTAGATGVLPWHATGLPLFLEEASARGWKIHLLDSGPGSESYLSVQPSGRDILVVGNEASGISGDLRGSVYQKVRIDPAAGDGGSGFVESLNASVASAIVMARFCSEGREG